jgi:glycerol uptake facilitator-like aquaporin
MNPKKMKQGVAEFIGAIALIFSGIGAVAGLIYGRALITESK